jgi:threonine dehydrogenase-like Zn-dependent dehydrogenase
MRLTGRALVHTGPNRLEEREFPLPAIGDDAGLLRVQRCGLCGTDVEQVHGDLTWVPMDVIPGHEPVGVIEAVGDSAAARWGVQPGDRVVVEAFVPCRRCGYCAAGQFSSCPAQIQLGFVPVSHDPPLLGGFAEYLYLPPNATLHKMSSAVAPDLAPFYNALTCGVDWVTNAGGVSLGSTVVVLGCGPRGIACGLVAKAAGAEQVIVTGLTADAPKLAVARELGADATIDVEQHDVSECVRALTAGRLADVVIDVVPGAAATLTDAIDITRPRGTIVIAGMKGDRAVPGLRSDQLVLKALTVKGVRGKRSSSYGLAISILESQRFPLDRLAPRAYPLSDALQAIEDQAGNGAGPAGLCVSIAPGE